MIVHENPDVTVVNEGTIWVFEARTDAALAFLRDNAVTEEWQWGWHGLAVEHRYGPGLVQALEDDGFIVEQLF